MESAGRLVFVDGPFSDFIALSGGPFDRAGLGRPRRPGRIRATPRPAAKRRPARSQRGQFLPVRARRHFRPDHEIPARQCQRSRVQLQEREHPQRARRRRRSRGCGGSEATRRAAELSLLGRRLRTDVAHRRAKHVHRRRAQNLGRHCRPRRDDAIGMERRRFGRSGPDQDRRDRPAAKLAHRPDPDRRQHRL